MLGAEVLIGLASLMCTRNDPRADLSLIGLDIGLLFGLLFGVLFLLLNVVWVGVLIELWIGVLFGV
ncbi:MAG: hypothetical protein ACKN9M_10500 [Burkholderiaceae bacterium]